ncbi:pentapeptide repeat-containing protein [Branchiibius sp. NY16-3462-2]|uniref:pentapeptide repeat-containing protein n=1 Tax=Branchiibius sp. NY16-3462-2 TaxID=1807500 RepID=UPI0025BB8980|nr:pentapeptide repeat-containing protein [Branchiibius sp. NY16-3462-2]
MIQALRQRWQTQEGITLKRQVRRWLAGQSSRPQVPLIDGKLDLRGMRITYNEVASSAGEVGVVDTEWQGLDLRYSELSHLRFSRARIVDCDLSAARCDDLRFWGSAIQDSDLRSAYIRDSNLGAIEVVGNEATTWEKVDLRRSKIKSAHFTRSNLSAVQLSGAHLTDVSFVACDFSSVNFDCTLRRTRFEMLDVRSRAMTKSYPSFHGATFEDVFLSLGRYSKEDFDPGTAVIISEFSSNSAEFLNRLEDDQRLSAEILRAIIHQYAGRSFPQGEDKVFLLNDSKFDDQIGETLPELL